MVRPLGLAAPLLILFIASPLLRPLRHPTDAGADETLRLATIRALVEHHTLQLDHAYVNYAGALPSGNGVISSQPPMLSLLLWGPAWVMHRAGVWFDSRQILCEYLLTFLGVTLPAAAAAGFIYRMGRLFELRRAWRAGLAAAAVAGSGMLSYATVLNPYVPAAVALIGCAGCLIHVASVNRADRTAGWFALAGACGMLSATIAPAAIVLFVMFWTVIIGMRFSISRRMVGVALYALGAVPIAAIHCAWNQPITGNWVPSVLSPVAEHRKAAVTTSTPDDWDDDSPRQGTLNAVLSDAEWVGNATLGKHGMLSHFPALFLGALGIAAVMHRHWPSSTKTLAAATGIGGVVIVILYRIGNVEFGDAMFASKWFVVFTPLLLFWSGAWLRRSHRPGSWMLAAAATAMSVCVGIIGATDPMPHTGFRHFTAISAFARLIQITTPAAIDASSSTQKPF